MTNDVRADATSDLSRRVTVMVGAAVAILGAAWGSGAFGGTPIAEAADGALAEDATLLAPASGAFSIWSLIYAGLLGFAVYQLLPRSGVRPRVRAVAWWVLASLVLNAVWIAAVQAELLWVSVLILAALVAVLGVAARRLIPTRAQTRVESVLVDGVVGVYLGWTIVATLANTAAVLVATVDGAAAADGMAWAVAACAIAAALAVIWAVTARHAPMLVIAVGLAMTWGLGAIALARATGHPESLPIMWAAGLAAAVAFAAPFAAIDAARPSPDARRTTPLPT